MNRRRRGADFPAVQSVHAGQAALTKSLSHPVMIVLFLLTATQPYSLLIGPLLMGPYRLVLILLSVPLVIGWLSGKYGRWVLPDFLLIAFVGWIFIALIAVGQTDRVIEYGFAQVFDIFIAYLLGRAAIRNKQDFYFFVKCFLFLLLFLLPFAAIESLNGKMILQDAFRGLPNTKTFNPVSLQYDERMGMQRAQTSINHPIVFGLFCSMGASFALVGLAYYKGGMSIIRRTILGAGALGGTFFSLSAGPLASMVFQLMLIGWSAVTRPIKSRWYILGGIGTSIYIFLDIVAERPPLLVMARMVAFSSSTAWNRYQIWIYGTDEVARNPIFGMGLFTYWIRLPWMPLSVDNHWLLVAMRFGIPAIVLLLWAYFYIVVRLIRMNLARDEELAAIRYSFVFTFLGMFVALGTVVSWHVQYSLLIMLLGGAVWIFNNPTHQAMSAAAIADEKAAKTRGGAAQAASETADAETAEGATAPEAARQSRYTRFPASQSRSTRRKSRQKE